jgi:hypothetical protein
MEKRTQISKGDEDNETISAEKKRFDGCVGRLHGCAVKRQTGG